MTQHEIAYYTKKLNDLGTKLKDLAGRYRMQNSGAYKETLEIVKELQSRTDRNNDDDSDDNSEIDE